MALGSIADLVAVTTVTSMLATFSRGKDAAGATSKARAMAMVKQTTEAEKDPDAVAKQATGAEKDRDAVVASVLTNTPKPVKYYTT